MPGPELHVEPFVHLVDLTPDRALVGWGAFWFLRSSPEARWEIVDDEALPEVAGRRECVGARAEPYGDTVVEVLSADDDRVVARAETSERAWTWVTGLQPDTDYRYRVLVDGREWAAGERWDWVPTERGGYDLAASGRSYDLRFRTPPSPGQPAAFRFAAMGDYGVGTRADSESSRRQRRVAAALERLVADHDVRFLLSLGDNIYQGEEGAVDGETGGEDDDWYSSFYSPYRYVISRVPVYPAVGNHDASDSESSDDRLQMQDNFHTDERFHDLDGRASVDPGLFYRFSWGRDVELVCIDTSLDDGSLDREVDPSAERFFEARKHREWLRETFRRPAPRWRIPFSHHPAYCAGPHHGNDEQMVEQLVPLFREGGVRLALAGHEHNFQVSVVDGCSYIVSGAGGQLREEVPRGFDQAHTRAWSAQAHLLVVEVEPDELRVTPYAGLLEDGRLHRATALSPRNEVVYPPYVVRNDEGEAHAHRDPRPRGTR